MDRGVLDQLEKLLRPLMNRVTNMVARGSVQVINDAKKQQMVQLGVQVDEDVDDGEHFQAYGFSSVPLGGSEAVVLFPDGDRERPLVVVVSDRRHRPTGGEPGEVTVYNHTGAKMKFTKDGDIEVTPAPGREVLVGGTAVALATKADVTALANFVQGLFVGGSGSVVVPPGTVPQPVGTTVLKAE